MAITVGDLCHTGDFTHQLWLETNFQKGALKSQSSFRPICSILQDRNEKLQQQCNDLARTFLFQHKWMCSAQNFTAFRDYARIHSSDETQKYKSRTNIFFHFLSGQLILTDLHSHLSAFYFLFSGLCYVEFQGKLIQHSVRLTL